MASNEVVCRANIPDHTSFTREKVVQKNARKKGKSKGHLAHRSAGIPPFSAWVEPVTSCETSAMQHALSVELKMKKVVSEKETRLKDFQSQVQSRVRMLERMKRQEQLGKSVEAVEIVRNIVHQSSFPRVPSKKSGLAKQDTCSYRDGQDQPIMRPITRGILAHSHEAVDKASQLLEEHAKEIRLTNKHARSVLKSRALTEVGKDLQTELPGGQWNPSCQHDNILLPPKPRDKENIPDKSEVKESESFEGQGDYWMGAHEIQDVSYPGEIEEIQSEDPRLPQWLAQEDRNKVTIFDPAMINGSRPKRVVRFAEERSDALKKENESKRNEIRINEKFLRKKAIENLLKPGKVAEDFKQQQKSQMALYRKLFMDIEREQVRENIRMKEHRKRMAEIKVEKEINRLQVEHQYKELLASEEQRIQSEKWEQHQREQQDNQAYNKYIEQRHTKLQKSKESERFTEAMKAVLKDKMKVKGISVPPLCACGPSVWDANPDTCANNCIYYKNPKEYAKALSSLISSLDL